MGFFKPQVGFGSLEFPHQGQNRRLLGTGVRSRAGLSSNRAGDSGGYRFEALSRRGRPATRRRGLGYPSLHSGSADWLRLPSTAAAAWHCCRARAPDLIPRFNQALQFGCAHHSAACAAGQSSSAISGVYAAYGAPCSQASRFVHALSRCGSATLALLRPTTRPAVPRLRQSSPTGVSRRAVSWFVSPAPPAGSPCGLRLHLRLKRLPSLGVYRCHRADPGAAVGR